MQENSNSVSLTGTVSGAPVYSHENHTQRFYRFPLSIERLSGEKDVIEILALESAVLDTAVEEGMRLTVMGQLRSYNNRSGEGRRLVITVLANVLIPGGDEDQNSIFLTGTLCKAPTLRRTPLGRSICDIMLAVNRRYGRSDYLPCIAWGALAMQIGGLSVGDQLRFEGRIQSRSYMKLVNGISEERTAYEVSIMHLLNDSEV